MLEKDPIQNLQYDSQIRPPSQPQRSAPDPPILEGPQSITSIRRISNVIQNSVSTLDASALQSVIRAPNSGFSALYDMPSVHIEQTFELNEHLTVQSENRYVIRSPLNEALFSASESSETKDRNFWGSNRPFKMHILNREHQEALLFKRKLALGFLCMQPKSLEVWSPPGNYLGQIIQTPSCFTPEFNILGAKGELLYRVEGPETFFGCLCFKPLETYFKIYSSGDKTLKGTITRKWNDSSAQYAMNIYFQNPEMNINSKALFVGAGMLLEYLYFQTKY